MIFSYRCGILSFWRCLEVPETHAKQKEAWSCRTDLEGGSCAKLRRADPAGPVAPYSRGPLAKCLCSKQPLTASSSSAFPPIDSQHFQRRRIRSGHVVQPKSNEATAHLAGVERYSDGVQLILIIFSEYSAFFWHIPTRLTCL